MLFPPHECLPKLSCSFILSSIHTSESQPLKNQTKQTKNCKAKLSTTPVFVLKGLRLLVGRLRFPETEEGGAGLGRASVGAPDGAQMRCPANPFSVVYGGPQICLPVLILITFKFPQVLGI